MKPTFANLIKVTAKHAYVSEETTRLVLETFFETLAEAVWAHGRVAVPRLGLFKVRTRPSRQVLDPEKTDGGRYGRQRVHFVAAHRAVVCRVAKSWRRRDG